MKTHATLATAAVVLVILPLLITLSALTANAVMESTGISYSLFGPFGSSQLLLAGVIVTALVLAGALIGALMKAQIQHHA